MKRQFAALAAGIVMAAGGAATGAQAQTTEIKISYQPALFWSLPFYVAAEKGW